MSLPLPENEWKLKTNAEYQEAMKIVMNLSTASLVLPIFFVKNFTHYQCINNLSSLAIWSWALLVLSIASGLGFHYASAKFVKIIYGGKVFWQEKTVERLRDFFIGSAVFCFMAGVIVALFFFRTLN